MRRNEKNLTAAELARRVSISKGYLHNLETGEAQNPSAEILFKIANELGTTIADLMGETEIGYERVSIDNEDIPQSLREFAEEAKLPESDILMLVGIQYRGKRPESIDDWRFIYESIRRTLK